MALTCEQKLEQAQTALHELQIGQQAVEITDGDFRARYTSANVGSLQAYVDRLLAECGPDAQSGCGCAGRRPLRFYM